MGKEDGHSSSSPTDPKEWVKEKEGTPGHSGRLKIGRPPFLGSCGEAFESRAVVEGGGMRRKKRLGSQAQRTRMVQAVGGGVGGVRRVTR